MHTLHPALIAAVLALWCAAGVLDGWWYRQSAMAESVSLGESLLRFAMFLQIGLMLGAVLLLEINAGVLLLVYGMFLTQELVAYSDERRAEPWCFVSGLQQKAHGVCEYGPMVALAALLVANWGQFLALFGVGGEVADFTLVAKADPFSQAEVLAVFAGVAVVKLMPCIEEIYRAVAGSVRSRANV